MFFNILQAEIQCNRYNYSAELYKSHPNPVQAFFLSCYRNYNLFLYLLYALYSVNILREYLQYLACQIRNAIT